MLTYIVIFYRRFHPLSSQEVNRLPLSTQFKVGCPPKMSGVVLKRSRERIIISRRRDFFDYILNESHRVMIRSRFASSSLGLQATRSKA